MYLLKIYAVSSRYARHMHKHDKTDFSYLNASLFLTRGLAGEPNPIFIYTLYAYFNCLTELSESNSVNLSFTISLSQIKEIMHNWINYGSNFTQFGFHYCLIPSNVII
jgi:hypothetical protein